MKDNQYKSCFENLLFSTGISYSSTDNPMVQIKIFFEKERINKTVKFVHETVKS